MKRCQVLATVCLGAFASVGSARVVDWVPNNGSGSFFTYANGFSDNGLFGNPILIGDTFAFTPIGFVANSVNGSAASVPDRIQVDLTANAGQRFTMIRVREFGSWGITGIGSVNAFGSLNLVDMINIRPPAIDALNAGITSPFAGPLPNSTPGSGLWSGEALIDLNAIIGAPWTKLRLVFTNTVQAGSQQGSAAFIDKKVIEGPSIFVDILPTPGSASILVLGGMLAARRRR